MKRFCQIRRDMPAFFIFALFFSLFGPSQALAQSMTCQAPYQTTVFDSPGGINGFTTPPSNPIGTFQYSEFAGGQNFLSIQVNQWGQASQITDGIGDDAGYTGTALIDGDEDRAIEFERTISAAEAGTYSVNIINGDDHVLFFRNGVQIDAVQNAYSATGPRPDITFAAGDVFMVRLVEEFNFNTALDLVETQPIAIPQKQPSWFRNLPPLQTT